MADDAPDLSAGVALGEVPADGVLAGTVGEEAVMLARWTDDAGREQVSALDASCTHVGAALPTGIRTGDCVRCPFHHATFDLRTGEALHAPAYQPLGAWEVQVADGRVRVTGRAQPGAAGTTPQQVPNERGVAAVVVIGGGAAGFAAVERLRRVGYDGSITVLSTEGAAPIDRTKLSKAYLSGGAGADALPLLEHRWYAEHDVDLRTSARATGIDLAERTVSLSDGSEVGYDALLIATGAEPERLDLPGFDREEVHLLRTREDSDAIIAAASAAKDAGKPVVVVGSGFIGLEVAASLRAREVEVTVVAPSKTPLVKQVGQALGAVVKGVHEANGVTFVVASAAEWTGSELVCEDGTRIEAAAVVVGAGVSPRTALAEAAGIAVDDGILVDARGETAHRGVFAAGDVARFPDPVTGRPVRVEHWAVAQRAGATAAVNMLGAEADLDEPTYFWTMHFGTNIRVSGHAQDTSNAEVEGDLDAPEVVVRYREDGRVTAVAGIKRDRQVLELEEELLREAV